MELFLHGGIILFVAIALGVGLGFLFHFTGAYRFGRLSWFDLSVPLLVGLIEGFVMAELTLWLFGTKHFYLGLTMCFVGSITFFVTIWLLGDDNRRTRGKKVVSDAVAKLVERVRAATAPPVGTPQLVPIRVRR